MTKLTIGSREWRDLIITGAEAMGISVNADQVRQLSFHCDLLIQWNQKINLTAITDPYEVAVKHVLDAIAPIKWIQNEARVLDMGSGGGFPGIPLKIINPSLYVTLMDSVTKKVSFLKHVIRTLKIKGCTAISGRVEALGIQKEYAGKFDVVVSRSFASLDKIIQWGKPFAASPGRIIALKGKNIHEEIASPELKNCLNSTRISIEDIKIKNYTLPHANMNRALVIVALA